MSPESHITARAAGEQLGLDHLEVIRRIRKGDIRAVKFGWNWAVHKNEVERVKRRQWYIQLMARREAASKKVQ